MGGGSKELQFRNSLLEGRESRCETSGRTFRLRKIGDLCGKDATKWLVCERPSPKLVDKCRNPG
jgi:hypothetical protein